jgi:hypothetical protein
MATKFTDPLYDDLDVQTTARLGLPEGLLTSIRTKGERSNSDQVSEAGARSVYQITPTTRKLILDKYGIDPYLNEKNASLGAGYLLKESLDRNKGDLKLAAAEYHGGTDRSGWGPRTRAYVGRVTGESLDGESQPTGGRSLRAELAAAQPQQSGIAQAYAAYKAGKMPADVAAEFENDVNAGKVLLPAGAALKASSPIQQTSASAPAQPQAQAQQRLGASVQIPQEAAQAYANGTMPADIRAEMEADIKSGRATLPALPLGEDIKRGLGLGTRNLIEGIGQGAGFLYNPIAATINAAVPSAQIPTLEGQAQNVANKLGLPTALTPTEQFLGTIQQMAASNLPTIGMGQAIQAAKGAPAVAREAGAVLAGNPAQQIISSATAGAASEAAKQSGAGPVGQVVAGLAGGITPSALQGTVQAARQAPARAAQVGETLTSPVVAGAEQAAPQAVTQAAQPTGAMVKATAPEITQDVAEAARQAARGGFGSNRALETLATGSAPNEATVAAAKRLGIDDALQPDHVTTNQAYRELAQAVKSVPGSELRAEEIAGLNRVAERADRIVSDFGGARDISNVSVRVKRDLQATQASLDQKADELYAGLRSKITPTERVSARTVLDTIEQRATDLGGKQNLSSMEKKILARLGGNENPTYANLDDVRRDLTAARVKNQGAFKDADSGLIKFLEGKLMSDQKSFLESKGLVDEFNLAQSTVRVRKGIEDDLTSLFGKTLGDNIVGDLTRGVANLSKGDTDDFVRLIKSVPENMRQEVAFSGLKYAFGKNAVNPEAINFNSYSKWYQGLINNKQAYVALMSNLPREARNQLRDLAMVSDGIAKASRERIMTGRIQAAREELMGADSMIGSLFDVAKRASIAVPIEAGAAALGIPPGFGLVSGITSALTKGKPDVLAQADKVLVSPEYQRILQQITKGVQPSKTEMRKASESKAMREFWRKLPSEVKDKIGASNPAGWIANTVQQAKDKQGF